MQRNQRQEHGFGSRVYLLKAKQGQTVKGQMTLSWHPPLVSRAGGLDQENPVYFSPGQPLVFPPSADRPTV